MPTDSPTTGESYALVLGSAESTADARAVASLLDALVTLLEAANQELAFDASIRIRVHPPEEGSVEIPFDIVILAGAAATLFSDPEVLLHILSTIKEYISVKRLLRGSTAAAAATDDGRIVVNSISITGNGNVVNLINKPELTAAVDTAFSRAEEDESISQITITNTSTGEDIVRIPREEFRYFRISSQPAGEGHPPRVRTLRTVLTIRSPVLEGRAKWRFTFDGRSIGADVTDSEFLNKVNRRVERFGAGDQLEVSLDVEETYNLNLADYEPTGQYTVTEVYRHIAEPPEQPNPHPQLPFPD